MHELIEELQAFHRLKAQQLLALEKARNDLLRTPASHAARKQLAELLNPFQGPAESAHHRNEEAILRQLRTTDAPIHRRVDEISGDHSAFARIIEDLVRLITDAQRPVGEVRVRIDHFINQYGDHASNEELIFFPIADQHLTGSDWQQIKLIWI